MVERFHQSLKYEEIWPNGYEDPLEARRVGPRKGRRGSPATKSTTTKGVPLRLLTTECLMRYTASRLQRKRRSQKPDTLLSLPSGDLFGETVSLW